MKSRSSLIPLLGLALVGWLGIGVSGASAQSVYFEPYVEP
jgi:hypothetical protein